MAVVFAHGQMSESAAMNSSARTIVLAALAAYSSLVIAQEPMIPKKYENASPEIRRAAGLPPSANVEPPSVDTTMLRSMAAPDEARCAQVRVSAPVKFHGRMLNEIPDITEPQLRLANQLISNGCANRAIDNLDAVIRAQPDNRNSRYVIARMSWMMLGMDVAERELSRALRQHPDFMSAKVLLAGIRFQQERLPEAVALLDEVEPRSPTDVWVYLGRLRIEALRSPSRDLRVRLFEVMRNPAFPPNAREGAATIAKLLPQTAQEHEEVLWAQLEIDSGVGMACKASELAFMLGDGQGRFGEVIKLLESPRAKQGNCLGLAANRTMLAQAYLMEAAKLSPRPAPANRAILEKADRLLNGDFTDLAARAHGRPHYPTIKPFLDEYVSPLEEDEFGNTRLCNAIGQLDAAAVREQFEAGADPNGRCGKESLVGSLVFMATVHRDDARRAVMLALLEHGAPVTNIDACRSRNTGDCSEVLLPLMEKFAPKK